MKGVAVSQLEKMFVIFGARAILEQDGFESEKWLDEVQVNAAVNGHVKHDRVFEIHNFPTFYCSVNFARPEEAQSLLTALTTVVEAECPVGAAFGVKGVGEGIVWKPASNQAFGFRIDDLIFKVKGEKHSDTKVKTLVEVDVEKIANAREFATATVTEHRLEKMVEKLKAAGLALDVKNTGEFLKSVSLDILKEENDRLAASELAWKDVTSHIATVARSWWMEQLNKF